MPDYPEWVLKYKTKGIYIKKTKNGYSLYRGHSERVDGKKYPVLRCDEYLGIVTEEDGLIPSRPPVKKGVAVKTYGIEYIAERCCSVLREPLKRRGLDDALLYAHALLSLGREDNGSLYSMSILSCWHGGDDYLRQLSLEEEETIKRLKRQMKSKLEKVFEEDTEEAVSLLAGVYAVFVNERWVLSDIPERLGEILRMHNQEIRLEEGMSYGRKQGTKDTEG